MLIPLQSLIEAVGEDKSLLQSILSSFSCDLDTDIEFFLHNKAEEFEQILKARTYLVCDDEEMKSGRVVILGYFSLSLKVLILPDELSIHARKKIDGYRGKIRGVPVREIPCYLIGQLAKNMSLDNNPLSGESLLNEALAVVEGASRIVGGRCVMVESHAKDKLLEFYQKNEFEVFLEQPMEGEPMVQLLRKLI